LRGRERGKRTKGKRLWQEEGSSGDDGGRTCVAAGRTEVGVDVAVHRRRRRRRREVFVQNDEGWLNCYRSSSRAQISFTLQHPPSPILSRPWLSPASLSLSTHYANMRYQLDGDPRLFVSPILIARPTSRSVNPRVRIPSSVPKFDAGAS